MSVINPIGCSTAYCSSLYTKRCAVCHMKKIACLNHRNRFIPNCSRPFTIDDVIPPPLNNPMSSSAIFILSFFKQKNVYGVAWDSYSKLIASDTFCDNDAFMSSVMTTVSVCPA